MKKNFLQVSLQILRTFSQEHEVAHHPAVSECALLLQHFSMLNVQYFVKSVNILKGFYHLSSVLLSKVYVLGSFRRADRLGDVNHAPCK